MEDEDFWGRDDDHPVNESKAILEREGAARQSQFHNMGYREGVEAGKAVTVQHGFNLGFREGAAAGAALGRTSAAVKTLEIFAGQVSGTAQMQPRVAALLAQIQSIPPRNAMLSIFQQLLLRDPDAAELHNFTRVGAVASEAYLQPSMTGGGGRHRTQHARDQHDEKGLEEKETKDLGEQQDMPSALELAQAVALQSVTRREEAAKELDTIELHDMDALIRSVYQELKQLGCDISGSLDTPAVVLPVRGAAEHAMKIGYASDSQPLWRGPTSRYNCLKTRFLQPEFRRPPGILRHAQLGEANNALDMHAETKTVVAQLVICCEFAEIAKEAAAKATIRSQASSSMSSSDDVSSSTSARERKLKPTPVPRLGERYIHKEIRSLVKQIEMAMATNRRAGGIFDLHVTSWQPGSDVDVFGRFINAHTWPMTRHTAPLSQLRDLFPLEKLVMLSPDAPEPLDTIERDKVYCIGGIIDRTVCKVQEHAEALGMGQGTMRSPVLNVSDVVVALVQVARGQDWAAALSCSIPQRKKRATTPKPPRQRARKLGGAFVPSPIASPAD